MRPADRPGPAALDPLAPVLRALDRTAGASSDFDLNPGAALPPGRVLRPAAVLVPFLVTGEGAEVILTKRSSRLKHHPGQIAFPGGKLEPEDPDPESGALREAQEEIGLDPARVTLLGRLPAHETVTNFRVTPILGRVTGSFTPVPQPGEVDEVFAVPFAHLADPGRFRVERRRWRGEWRSYYIVPYGPYYIWGATARILYGLAQRMAQ
ncbi:NUDIX hydrolase [Solirhodobacter olei]|uniref:NUDIX hydrolase n=1 Tax=Solirhodobacter olei TaxID=2493082 RepID=UPI003BAB250A